MFTFPYRERLWIGIYGRLHSHVLVQLCSPTARFPLSVRFTINILPETFDSKGFAHQMAVLLNVSDSKVVIQDMQPVNGQTTVTVLFSTTAANALDRVSSSDLETLGVNGGPKVVISHQYLSMCSDS